MRARDAGFEVVYQGIRLTPQQIVAAAVAEDVHLVGISILSGSHMELVPEILRGLRDAGAGEVPVVVGGIIPDSDARALRAQGVAAVFTPKDFGLTEIMGEMVDEIRRAVAWSRDARPRLTQTQPGTVCRVGSAGRPGFGLRARRRAQYPLQGQRVVHDDHVSVATATSAPTPSRARARAGVADAAYTASARAMPTR